MFLACALAATATSSDLRITVYDRTHRPAAERKEAFDRTTSILAKAGLNPIFVEGDLSSADASFVRLIQPPATGHERDALCQARRDIALEIADGPNVFKAAILGVAQPLSYEGLNAQVFSDRVWQEAAVRRQSYPLLLAYVIAHEIGHVLLRLSDHTASGIMAGNWGDREYTQVARGLLAFTRNQSRQMQSVLNGAGCPAGLSPVGTLPTATQ